MGNTIISNKRAIRAPTGASGEHKLYGREAEKKKIIEFLRDGRDEMDVLPIVGTGGIGKTTLVQYIYNDEEVVHLFQLRAWVCISKDRNLRNILWSTTEDITKQACDLHNPNSEVLDMLKDKKFCIVLDDLWSDDIMQWKELCALLMAGAPGSKILVTTRKVSVADLVKTIYDYIDLNILSENDSLDLFWSTVGNDIRASSNSKLKELGEKISQKCGGLPLAVTILGSLLRGNHNEDDWNALLNSNSLVSQDGLCEIDSVLKMSYNDLPYDLKNCFLFCTIFPEDHQFINYDLMQLWIAAGVIKSDMKKVNSYFMELVSRSLLTYLEGGYVMHDLIREMGINVSNDRYCRCENGLNSWHKARHLSIKCSTIGQFIKDLEQREEEIFPLRTLMIHGEYNIEQIDDNLLFPKLRKLRVLYARALPIQKLSKSICQIQHLQYLQLLGLRRLSVASTLQSLRLDGCRELTGLLAMAGSLSRLEELRLVKCKGLTVLPGEVGSLSMLRSLQVYWCMDLTGLPAEVGNLGNLEYLELNGCTNLMRLPAEIGRLGNLKHLKVEGCPSLTELPVEMGSLGSLTYLWLVGCTGLKKLPAEMGRLSSLEFLGLEECTKLIELPAEMWRLSSLQYLGLTGCTGLTELPTEVERLSCLQYLWLNGCTGLTGLPMERLGNLVYLGVEGCTGLTTEMRRLVTLKYQWMGCCQR